MREIIILSNFLLTISYCSAQTNIFPSSGNVGIGTSNPTSKLHISGPNTYDAIFRLTNTGAGGGDWSLISTKTGWDAGGQKLLFSYGNPSSANAKVVFTNTGKVGIGTTAPQSELAVNGTITSQKVKITQTGWPDYVFDSAYTLRTISNLETFIQANKHLPDIPSEKEIAENGNDLGRTDSLLLKK